MAKVSEENEKLKSELLCKIKDLKSARTTVARLDGNNKALTTEKTSFEEEVVKLTKDVEDWTTYLTGRLKERYEALAEQIGATHPEFDLSPYGLHLQVRDGQLVDIPEDEEMDEN